MFSLQQNSWLPFFGVSFLRFYSGTVQLCFQIGLHKKDKDLLKKKNSSSAPTPEKYYRLRKWKKIIKWKIQKI